MSHPAPLEELAALYFVAADRYEREADQRREDAELRRKQMDRSSVDGQMILLNEAIIHDKAAGYLYALAGNLREAGAAFVSDAS